MNNSTPYAAVENETSTVSIMRAMILTYQVMMDEAEGIIKSTINPITKAYWRGRRDVYELQLESCKIVLGIDSLIESSK